MIELGLGCYSVVCGVLTTTLRALRPPLHPRLERFLEALQRRFYTSSNETLALTNSVVKNEPTPNAAARNSSLEAIEDGEVGEIDELLEEVASFVQRLKSRAERYGKIRREKLGEDAKWRIFDFVLNMLLFSIYVTIAIVAVVLYLFLGK